jgi:magnesium-transporting ATPase (P-type)
VAYAEQEQLLPLLLPFVKVFARGTPDQKAIVITGFEDLGLVTLMCGDGTNDVGALKRAHVGVALMAVAGGRRKKKSRRPLAATTRLGRRAGRGGSATEDPTAALLDDVVIPKLGDASIAAPFTSRESTVMSTCNVVRQGRCALVTSHQMLVIMALNCASNSHFFSPVFFSRVLRQKCCFWLLVVFFGGFFFPFLIRCFTCYLSHRQLVRLDGHCALASLCS